MGRGVSGSKGPRNQSGVVVVLFTSLNRRATELSMYECNKKCVETVTYDGFSFEWSLKQK